VLASGSAVVIVAALFARETANKPVAAQSAESYGRLPLSFEPNHGQAAGEVKFLSRGRGYTLLLARDETIFAFRKSNPRSKVRSQRSSIEPRLLSMASTRLQETTDNAQPDLLLRMRLLNANPSPNVVGLNELPGKSNYFFGRDSRKWFTNIPTYAKVEYVGVYPGVDLIYYGNQQQLEYDYVVAPGADPSAIRFTVGEESFAQPMSIAAAKLETSERKAEGGALTRLRVDINGDLIVEAPNGEIRFHRPIVYQPASDSGGRFERQAVDGRYTLTAQNQVAFTVGAYDRSRALVIDPVLSYSTYLGGTGFDEGQAIAVDSDGNAYVAGVTPSTDFPTTRGAIQTSFGGAPQACNQFSIPCGDAFVTKINSQGSALVYSTYFGGSDSDGAFGIALDKLGNAYVTGFTNSTDFPTTPGAFQPRFGGTPPVCHEFFPCGDAFVTKLNAEGSALVYSTYLGGSTNESGEGIAVDILGNAYVTGITDSADFPTTLGSFQPRMLSCVTPNPCTNGFVTKLNAQGTRLVYSTYLGGNLNAQSMAIAINSFGNAYVTGSTDDSSFPVTANAFQNSIAPGTCGAPPAFPCDDVFVTELNAAGSQLLYSTYFGGSGWDNVEGIAIGPSDEDAEESAMGSSAKVYISGWTGSLDLPTTPGAFQRTIGGGICNAFYGVTCADSYVAKFDPSKAGAASLVYSTYLGGSNEEFSSIKVAVDASGHAYVAGRSSSTDFPTDDALQPKKLGSGNAVVTKLDPTGSSLVYSTYLGGSIYEQANAIALDKFGNAYVTGFTFSPDFPLTPRAFRTPCAANGSFNCNGNAFVAKISPIDAPGVTFLPISLSFGNQAAGSTSPPQTVTLRNVGSKALDIGRIFTTPGDDFHQTNTCSNPLGPGESCTITVTFTPTKAGPQNGFVLVIDNATPAEQQIPLTGSAV